MFGLSVDPSRTRCGRTCSGTEGRPACRAVVVARRRQLRDDSSDRPDRLAFRRSRRREGREGRDDWARSSWGNRLHPAAPLASIRAPTPPASPTQVGGTGTQAGQPAAATRKALPQAEREPSPAAQRDHRNREGHHRIISHSLISCVVRRAFIPPRRGGAVTDQRGRSESFVERRQRGGA
jgi:hypothetical protein